VVQHKSLYCLGIVANEKPWYTKGMAGLNSPRGMIHEKYIRIKVISFPTLFLLIKNIISYSEIYNKSMLGLTKTGSLSWDIHYRRASCQRCKCFSVHTITSKAGLDNKFSLHGIGIFQFW